MLNGITTARTRGSIAACLASLVMLVGVAPAGAAPGGNVVISGDAYVRGGRTVFPAPEVCNRPRVIVHGDACGCSACCAQREYARGVNRGEAAGSNQGFRDGINGKPFCADLRDDLCGALPAYRDGYLSAFGKSYKCAYQQGQAQRYAACHRPVIRPRCPW